MYRTREYRRSQRERVINRKEHIIHDQNDYWNIRYRGMLSKGKIHCSCWMCRRKSYDTTKMQDMRILLSSRQDIEDYIGKGNKIYNKIRNEMNYG